MTHLSNNTPPKTSVLVLYAEPSLQTTLTLSADLSIKQVIAKGQTEIENHIAAAHGLPKFNIDPECTDFFPAADHSVKIGDLPGLKTIVCWPRATDGSERTPSPLTDLLNKLKSSQGTSSASRSQVSLNDSEVSTILARLARLEATDSVQDELRRGTHARITNLEREQAAAQAKIAHLEKQNKDLTSTVSRLQSGLTLSMSAVTGDDDAVAKVLFRVLGDRGRAQLARICGCDSWEQLEAECVDANDLFNTASRHIRRDGRLGPYWKAIVNSPSALWALITPEPEFDCDLSAEVVEGVESNAISASIESLPEGAAREDMITIYRAIFNAEPDLEPQ